MRWFTAAEHVRDVHSPRRFSLRCECSSLSTQPAASLFGATPGDIRLQWSFPQALFPQPGRALRDVGGQVLAKAHSSTSTRSSYGSISCRRQVATSVDYADMLAALQKGWGTAVASLAAGRLQLSETAEPVRRVLTMGTR